MAVVAISDSILTDIADAIRSKNGTENTYKPAQMPDAIEAISGGGITPTGTIEITQNGTHDVTNYASASVAVPTGSTPVINSLSVTENGTYTAPSGVDGYSPVTVNVSGGGGVSNSDIVRGVFHVSDIEEYSIGEFTLPSVVSSGYITVPNPANAIPENILVIRKDWYDYSEVSSAELVGGFNYGNTTADDSTHNRTINRSRDSHVDTELFSRMFLAKSGYNLLSTAAPSPTSEYIYLRAGNVSGSTKWLAGTYIIAVKPTSS